MIAIVKDWVIHEDTTYHFIDIGTEKEAEKNICWLIENLINYKDKIASIVATGENFTWFEEGPMTFEEAKENIKHLFK